MDVDRVVLLDVPHEVEVPLERDVRVVAALNEDLDRAQLFGLVDLLPDLLERQHVALVVLGPPVERAKLAVGNAHIRIVDVSVHDVGHHVPWVECTPHMVRHRAQLEERSTLVQFEVLAELRGVTVDHSLAFDLQPSALRRQLAASS